MNHDLALSLGERIRQTRLKRDVSQEKLALLTGIDRSYMGRIERGKVSMTIEKLYQIAQALDIEPKELLP